MLDFLAGAALLAQAVEGELPRDVGLEVVRLAAGPEDQVLVFGALRDKGTDFILLEDRGVSGQVWDDM